MASSSLSWNVPLKKAFPAVLLGLLLALTIMSIITYVIPWLIALAV